MRRFNSINQVWDAIGQGKTVYWVNTSYALTVEPHFDQISPKAFIRDNKFLRVTCTSNYFGSILIEKEINQLFTLE